MAETFPEDKPQKLLTKRQGIVGVLGAVATAIAIILAERDIDNAKETCFAMADAQDLTRKDFTHSMVYNLLYNEVEGKDGPTFSSQDSLRKTVDNCEKKFEILVPFDCAAKSIRKTLASPDGDRIIPKNFIQEARDEEGECQKY